MPLRRTPLAIIALVTLLGGWIFAPALTGGQSFAFRDAAHYYYPLFQWTRAEWGAGRIPLWNPLDNLGVSVVGESTTSVFYPGKLIFALPIDFTWAYNLYVIAHVALAAWGSYRLARRWGASTLAAGLAAISYAFSGDVLFQVTNVVFLVGAAWLPWALASADRMVREGRAWSAAGLGLVLALMIIGGDPQMAVNTVLLVGGYLVFGRWVAQTTCCLGPAGTRGSQRGGDVPESRLMSTCVAQGATGVSPVQKETAANKSSTGDTPVPPREFTRALALFAFAIVAAALLAAVQIIPSWQATRASARASYDEPRNPYELAASAFEPGAGPADSHWYDGFLRADPQDHAAQIYQFSVGPWRAIEYLWPNISGRQFPTFHRWLDVLSAEGRVWTPSLYLGLLPFVLAITTFSLRRTAPTAVRFSSWMVVLGGLGSLGIYGLAWLVRVTMSLAGVDANLRVGDQVGGLYWLLTVVVPSYVYFRYPAKLMVIVALGLSMLAAGGWDRTWQSTDRRLPRAFIVLAGLSLVGLLVVHSSWNAFEPHLATISADPLFGPFDAQSARLDVQSALTQTAYLSVVLAILFSGRVGRKNWSWAPAACLCITVFDLAIAQAPLIAYAPAEAWVSFPKTLGAFGVGTQMRWPDRKPALRGLSMKQPGVELRFYRDPRCANQSWLTGGSLDRPALGVRWERNSLVPRNHLPYDISMVEVSETLASTDELAMWRVARRYADATTGLPHESVLDLLGAREAIVPAAIAPDAYRAAGDVALVPRPTALPRAWIVHDVVALPELHSRGQSTIDARTEGVLFPDGQPRDWRSTAVVEAKSHVEPLSNGSSRIADEEKCLITYDGPQRVEIDVTLTRPGLVVLRDRFDLEWRLSIKTNDMTREAAVMRTNRLMRGVWLPAGTHQLVYQYQPRGFWIGAAISVASILSLSLAAIVIAVWRRIARNPYSSAP